MTETANADVIEGIPSPATRDGKPTSVAFALISLTALLTVLGVGLLAFDAPLPLMMIVGFGASLVIAAIRGVTYENAENAAFDMIRRGLQALLIFVAVGALIASWILSGTVPTMIYLGVELIEPTFFLPTAILLCAITSFINGTNFGTVATIGLALMGVASALDIPAGIAAGAIISGAIFGDKMSPVSDTTVLAAGLSGVPLIRHIRHMMWTTVPAILICLVVFTLVGMNHDADGSSTAGIDDVASALESGFSIGWIPLLPPILVFGLLMARVEAFPALALGVVAGVAVAVWYQGVDLTSTLVALWEGYVPTEAQAESAGLLGGGETGGALKLLGLAAIIIFALAIAGVLAVSGVMHALLRAMEPRCGTPRRLVTATLVLSSLLNVIGGAVNFAVAMAVTTLRPLYDRQSLARRNLSRAAEDAGTTTGPLVPWNATAVFTSTALGVSVGTYLPWALFCIITPLISLGYALTGYTITHGPSTGRSPEGVSARQNGV